MKLMSLHLSNILSFPFVSDIGEAQRLDFEETLNIVIGENGAGKSTALEVINFVFRRVVFRHCSVNQEVYGKRRSIAEAERRGVLTPANDKTLQGFRLEPNWDTEHLPQKIRVVIKLDEIDFTNIKSLVENADKLKRSVSGYTKRQFSNNATHGSVYTLDINLNRTANNFDVQLRDCESDFGYEYLTDYFFFKETIDIHNSENPDDEVPTLFESFTLISSFRNYHTFATAVSLRDAHAAQQMQSIRGGDYSKSLNASETSEPSVFAIVRLRVAAKHFELMSDKLSEAECETAANQLKFLKDINERLKIVNLSCRIKLIEKRTWEYAFEFVDLRRGKTLRDINSLSAGQKAITHLVFEAYGRGDLKGGLVIIDEPEIHLHYQFQHEYLQVVRELNSHQHCQYILVSHSEALINSATISNVRRFSLNANGHTEIRSPVLAAQQKALIRILDNTRSTYAFFAKKVVLVEGDKDRYFFKAVFQAHYPNLDQDVAILHVGGKMDFPLWTQLFEAFGLRVYRIADLDYAYNLLYRHEPPQKLRTPKAVADFRSAHADCDQKITEEYERGTYILKLGDLEAYLGINKDLSEVIRFCNEQLAPFLSSSTDAKASEILDIVARIANDK